MEINNFELIRSLMGFRSADDFYFIQIIRRKKDDKTLHKNASVIKTYIIESFEAFDILTPRIIETCKNASARAYINLNRRSFKRVAFETLQITAKLVSEENYMAVRRVWDKACGSTSNEKDSKKWIIDVDDNSSEMFKVKLLTALRDLQPVNDRRNKVIAEIPTKNGYHFITSPFNKVEFDKLFYGWEVIPKPSIHTNSPTLLYLQ